MAAALLAASLGGPAFSAQEPCTEPGAVVGSLAAELGGVLAGAERVRRPPSLAGALGLWRVARLRLGRFDFEETFYFAGQRLQQVELVLLSDATPDPVGSAFDELLQSCRRVLGPELAARADGGDQVMETASWALETLDITLLRSGNLARTKTRVLYKARQLKDADTL